MPAPPSELQRRPIFVINLKRDTKRLALMKRQLEDMNLEFEVIEAADGSVIPEEERKKMTAGSLQPILPNELGCWLSHRKAWEIMTERGVSEALILEDDALLNEDFPEVFNGCELPEECQALQLIGKGDDCLRDLHRYCSSLAIPLPGGYRMSPRIGVLWGTQAYIIRLHYAQQMAQNMFPIMMSIDNLMFSWQHCLYAPWVVYKKNAGSGRRCSLIGGEASVADKRPAGRDDREEQLRRDMLAEISKNGKKLPPRKKGRPLPVFVINLERDAQRLAAMKQRLDADNIPFEVITAVDGEQVCAKILSDAETGQAPREALPPTLSPSETGRRLSHFKAYQAALKTGAPEAVILEDNISLSEDFPAWFHGGTGRCRMSNMVVQGSVCRRYFSPYRVKSLPSRIGAARTEGVMSDSLGEALLRQYARAYIIHRSQMQKLLKRREIVDTTIDALLFRWKDVKPRNWLLKSVLTLWMQFSLLRWPWLLNHGAKVQLYRLKDRSRALRYLKTILSLYSLPKPFGIKQPRVPPGAGRASP